MHFIALDAYMAPPHGVLGRLQREPKVGRSWALATESRG